MDYVDSIKKDLSKIVVVNFAAYKNDSLLVNQDLDSWNKSLVLVFLQIF